MKTSQMVGLALLASAVGSHAVMVTSVECSSPEFLHEPEGFVRVNFIWAHDEGFDTTDALGNRNPASRQGDLLAGVWSHESPGMASAGVHGWSDGWTARVTFEIATGVIMNTEVYQTHLPFQDITAIPGQGLNAEIVYDLETYSGSVTWTGTPEITPQPEPVPDAGATAGLLLAGAIGLGILARRK